MMWLLVIGANRSSGGVSAPPPAQRLLGPVCQNQKSPFQPAEENFNSLKGLARMHVSLLRLRHPGLKTPDLPADRRP